MAAPASPETITQIEALGAEFHSFPVQRNGLNPWEDIRTLTSLYKIFRQTRPDIIMAYTIKPIIWGGLAAIFSTKAFFVSLVEGLGVAFQPAGFKRKILFFIVKFLYKIALLRSNKVVFLNPDNEQAMLDLDLVKADKTARIDGIGINLCQFEVKKLCPSSPPTFLLIARLLSAKGIREYAHAAQKVKELYPAAIFNLLGSEDSSSDGVPLAEVQAWHDKGIIQYLGTTQDVRPYLAACHIFTLPSYYGEGLPRSIIEAMSTGRPVLTTDNVGCRETVIPDENGFLVPVRDVDALASRMIWFIEHREEWERMAKRSREMAEDRFDVRIINKELMAIMGLKERDV
jgi:glycosyltransferase involved in cell wall biosynthesis